VDLLNCRWCIRTDADVFDVMKFSITLTHILTTWKDFWWYKI